MALVFRYPVIMLIIAVQLFIFFDVHAIWAAKCILQVGMKKLARLSGIKVKKVRTLAYVASGSVRSIRGYHYSHHGRIGANRCGITFVNGIRSWRHIRRILRDGRGETKCDRDIFHWLVSDWGTCERINNDERTVFHA